jgi:hypothetical protein
MHNTMTRSVRELIGDNLKEGGYIVAGGRAYFMEVIDKKTGLVWMSAAPVTMDDFEALEIQAPLAKVGCALASMDCAAFQYSPAASDVPVLERVIQGRLYINVAMPMAQVPPVLPDGPIEISVNKSHIVGFEAGRSIAVLSLPEGDFIEVVGDGSVDDSLVLPEGSVLKRIELSGPLVVSLPTPTRAFFWLNQGMRSFQGPVTLPELV